MKKVLIIILAVLTCYHGFTRDKAARHHEIGYTSVFGETSTSWNIYFEIPDLLATDSLFVSGDTVIHDQEFRKVTRNGFINNSMYYLRESMDHSQVFFYSALLDSEFVVMDLNLELADSFYLGREKVNPIIVDSVFFVDNRKHIRFDTIMEVSGYREKFEFIEGVGTNFGLFYPGEFFLPHQLYLLCAWHDAIQVYDNRMAPGQCRLSWTSAYGTKDNSRLLLFPNPADEQLIINWEVNSTHQKFICHVYNAEGCRTKTQHAETFPITLNTQSMANGIYFIMIEGDKKFRVGKFVIRH